MAVENFGLSLWIFHRRDDIIMGPMSIESYQNKIYRVVAYTPDWERMFSEEAAALKTIFGNAALGVEHIGSTAVPGVCGKNIVDILIGVKSLSEMKKSLRDSN